MAGSATFTTVLSSMIMNSAKHIAASVSQRFLGVVSAIPTRLPSNVSRMPGTGVPGHRDSPFQGTLSKCAPAADRGAMTWGSRLCRECGTRFTLVRLDERLCQTCNAAVADLTRVDRYVKSHPGEPVTRVALATGVSEEIIIGF